MLRSRTVVKQKEKKLTLEYDTKAFILNVYVRGLRCSNRTSIFVIFDRNDLLEKI